MTCDSCTVEPFPYTSVFAADQPSTRFNVGAEISEIDTKRLLDPVDLNPCIPVPAEGQTKAAGVSRPGKRSKHKTNSSGFRQVKAKLGRPKERLLILMILTGESFLKATLNGGKLNLDRTKRALYDGAGKGRVSFDAFGKTPRVAKSFNLKGSSAEPLLTEAADFKQLEVKGDLDIAVTGACASPAAIARSLGGSGGFVFRNANIRSFNLAAILRKAETTFLDPGAISVRRTDFSEPSGTFKIKKDVSNTDLIIVSSLFGVTGKCNAYAEAHSRLSRHPNAVADACGQGVNTGISGIALPVQITGPWHDAQFALELAGIPTDLGSAPLAGAAKVAEGAVGMIKDVIKGIDVLLKRSTKGTVDSEPAKDTAPQFGSDANPIKQPKGLFGK